VTFREILAEFAAHRQGVDTQYEVQLFQRVSPRGEALDGFNIEDPQAMAAERERLEKMQRSRPLPAPKVPRIPRVTPCEQCGADVLENLHGGNAARFCSDTCRSAAHLAALRAEKRCRLATCGHDAAEGKTYCRPHLDAIAARERARRQQRTAETRKAA
jgi:hypothetical protein